MSHRGKAPIPEPTSTCPNPKCQRYFEGVRCPYCGYKRGDTDKGNRKRLTREDRERLMLDDAIRYLERLSKEANTNNP